MMHPDNEYLLRYMERLRSYAERYGMPFENDTALDFDWCLEMVDRAEQKGKTDAIIEALEPYDAESIVDLVHNAYSKGRNDAIDEVCEFVLFYIDAYYFKSEGEFKEYVKEQLKEKNNE